MAQAVRALSGDGSKASLEVTRSRSARWVIALCLLSLGSLSCGGSSSRSSAAERKVLSGVDFGPGWTEVRFRETRDQGGKFTERVWRSPDPESWPKLVSAIRASESSSVLNAFRGSVGPDDGFALGGVSGRIDGCEVSISAGADQWGSGVAAYGRARC